MCVRMWPRTWQGDAAISIFGDIADTALAPVRGAAGTVATLFGDQTVRIGVTGLARAGKTVFVTSLVANLLERGRMPQLSAAAEGRIEAAFLQPQPDDTIPRFPFEASLGALTGAQPRWPVPTSAVAALRLSLRVRPSGLLGGMQGVRTVHLDIVDYPGEWILDLGLLETTFEDWSARVLGRLGERPEMAAFRAALAETDPDAPHSEPAAEALARTYTDGLRALREAGMSDCTPGRFLMPGELAGSPALTFAPLPTGEAPRGSLAREFSRRYGAYVARVVKPFFREHFARIDRQVVLVDALEAIHHGPAAVADLERAMADLLRAFRPGRTGVLGRLLGFRRIDRVLFAATKADHLHSSQHPRLAAILEHLVTDARRRAEFAGARTGAMAIAALRATVEQSVEHEGRPLDVVRGRLWEDGAPGKEAAFHPGELPEDPSAVTRGGDWLADWGLMRFAPAPLTLRPGEGPPHIRLDRAAEFLFGDKL